MRTLFSLIFLIISVTCFSQEAVTESDTIRKDALNVYISASDYFKKEITFINYVRDFKESDVYIIRTYQNTGSGGEATTYFLVGQNKYKGMNDTIIVNLSPDDTQETGRIKEVKSLKMGLMRYMLKTPLAGYFDINFTIPVKETVTTDKWNSWVFSAGLDGSLDGEKSYKSSSVYGSLSANRVTEKNKFMFSYSYNWSEAKYDIDNQIISSLSRSQYANILYVKGLNEHWSLGATEYTKSSVYSNYDLSVILRPAIEYDIYPYSEATRRQLSLMYSIGVEYANYHDTTIYSKTKEILGSQAFSASYRLVEKWGSINISLYWNNYLYDFSKYNLSLYGGISLRIAKGLRFNISGGASLVHDQLSLEKGGATYEEILLRRKEIATQYTYFTSFGLSYTFGSIYNNAVNPRFGGGGGIYGF
jgi:hypothetical protein